MKQLIKRHKFLLPSAMVLTATGIMLIFDSRTITDFVGKLWSTLLNAALTGFGIYIVSIFSGWLLYPIMPKHEDFATDGERDRYFQLGDWDLWFFIYAIIATTLVFSGRDYGDYGDSLLNLRN
jgi:hypothetical protein